MIIAEGDMITLDTLSKEIQARATSGKGLAVSQKNTDVPKNNEELKVAKARARHTAEEHIERLFLRVLLSETGGNVSKAAPQAEMNRSWLSQLIGKHELDLNRFREHVSW